MSYHPTAEVDVILNAYLYSAKAHRGQSRKSGEAYFSHPVEVAFTLTRLKLDEKTVAAGLLHDTIEDTLTTLEEIQEIFGEEISQLVDGVTKISKMNFASKEESQAENYRKMILAMVKDIRVVLIKLADRAHNIKTLDSMTPETQRRVAKETLDIYAPLANRLGIGWLKTELENGAFKYLYPEQFEVVRKKVAHGQEERKKFVDEIGDIVSQELKEAGVKGRVAGRPKHLYSIYKKMVTQEIEFKDVFDLSGVRVITDSVKDCYAVLGLIHSLWKPIPGRFKDYIAMPKPNLYKSLHTTVIGPGGERVEVQIRTEDMHRVCEEGIAAHWQYKEKENVENLSSPMDKQLAWVRHLFEHQQDLKNPKEFLSAFKMNLFPSEVYVFTPSGDVISLPHGATPVDFAYAVHTDIGNHCVSAKVDGKLVPLRHKLKNGNQVHIGTSKNKTPSRDWLAFIKTSRARNRISHFIHSQEKEKCLKLGRELLQKELVDFGLIPDDDLFNSEKMEEAIHANGYVSMESLLIDIGFGKISSQRVAEKLAPQKVVEEMKKNQAGKVKLKEKSPPNTNPNAIKVECVNDNILIRIGKCCNALPGDPIAGYITRGRGVTVHHIDCPSVTDLEHESERLVQVEWSSGSKTNYPTRISIVGEDKPGLLANICSVLAQCEINIVRANVQQGAHKRAYLDLSIEIQDLEQLNRTLDEVKKVEGVIYLERVKEYNKKFSGGNRLDSNESENPGSSKTRAKKIENRLPTGVAGK